MVRTRLIRSSDDETLYGFARAKDGSLFASTETEIFRIYPSSGSDYVISKDLIYG